MKFTKTLLAVALCGGLFTSARAQTNASFTDGVKEMASAFAQSTNATAGFGYHRSLSGNYNIASAEVAYNISGPVGLILGEDVLFGKGKPSYNALKGGVTLSATIHPFAIIGSTWLTNVVGTPFVSDLLATPRAGNDIGNIVVTGCAFDIVPLKNWEFRIAPDFEKRSGQGQWTRNYFGVQFLLSKRF